MALSEKVIFGKIEILEDGQIQLREDIIVMRDNIEITRMFHRRVIEPDENHNETDSRLVSVINAIWTPEIITKYKRDKEGRENAVTQRRANL